VLLTAAIMMIARIVKIMMIIIIISFKFFPGQLSTGELKNKKIIHLIILLLIIIHLLSYEVVPNSHNFHSYNSISIVTSLIENSYSRKIKIIHITFF